MPTPKQPEDDKPTPEIDPLAGLIDKFSDEVEQVETSTDPPDDIDPPISEEEPMPEKPNDTTSS